MQWDAVLNKFFKNIPTGYTGYYFFEFSRGYVSYRRLATTEDKEAITVKMADSNDGLRSRLLMELFGKCDTSSLTFRDLKLPFHPGNALKSSKLKSLSKKYFSIPEKFLKFYPKVSQESVGDSNKENVASKRARDTESQVIPKPKRRLGRPKKLPGLIPGLQSVTKYFRPVNENGS